MQKSVGPVIFIVTEVFIERIIYHISSLWIYSEFLVYSFKNDDILLRAAHSFLECVVNLWVLASNMTFQDPD
jgi:hypothetical protein